ncbi:RHS repeat-associated core domain-containing protein [Flavobacteriaceae bacterium W22]|nr:RHS repeat-associated core domain-containing protein [Flavobacteriaceae bacterium W22]
MKKIIIALCLFAVNLILAQSLTTSENYVYTKVYLSADGSKKSETVQYFDGLGRAKQVVQIKATPLGQDLVVPVEYDQFGRESRKLLPIPAATGNGAIHGAVNQTAVNTYYGVANAYSEQKIEASPLARVQETAHPGTEWAMATGHTVKMEYLTNTTSDQVKKYNTTTSWNSGTLTTSISGIEFYSPNQLSKSKVTDEDGNVTLDFKNSEGKTVLLRKEGASGKLDTYYVYNNYGQLAFVISPKGNEKITANNNVVTPQILNDLCYQYVYDNRFRQVEKKLPGKGWEYMVYDQQNRLVATQDANMRNNSQSPNRWLFTRYDKFGRVAYTGVFTGGSRQQEQANANAKGLNNENRSTSSFSLNGQQIFYTNTAYPSTSFVPYSVNYYDTYPSIPGNMVSTPTAILTQTTLSGTVNITSNGVSSIRSLKSMATASMVKNLEDDAWSSTQIWYDRLGRAIGSHGKNHLGGYTKTEKRLDFAGVPQQVITKHKRLNSDNEKVITESFTYDNQNRLLLHKHKIDNKPEEILSRNKYNELSQLEHKKVGGTVLTNPLQQVDYTYNIRGWMTQINDPANLGSDLFGYKIKYHQVDGLEVPDTSDTSLKVLPRYNGNIAEVDWKTAAQANEPLKTYGYVYDDMNRLSAGFYQDETNPSLREHYEKVTYDSNGNIMSMKRTAQRMGSTALLIDNLTYQYEGGNSSNRLQKVSEAVPLPFGYPYQTTPADITYDDNGNMTSYQDKGISSIQYNYLNLPKQVTRNSLVTDYTYRADGVKVKKLFGTVETHYVDGFQYKSVGSEIKMVIIPTSEGYYDAQRDAYFYNFTDHLGNIRLSYSDADGNGLVTGDLVVEECFGGNCSSYIIPGEIEGISNYYPFGMLHNTNSQNINNAYQYKYNGKELQETGMYDYGARFYMPDIGRWGAIDPLAEMYTRHSPYHYAVNNPMRFIDPDGRSSQTFEGQDAVNAYWHLVFGGSISSLSGGSSFGSLGGQEFNLSSFFHYIDPGGSSGGGSSLSPWMQSYLGNTGIKTLFPATTQQNDLSKTRQLIIKNAMKHYDSKDWAYDVKRGRFSAGTNKCNLFVDEVLEETGIYTPNDNGILGLVGFGTPVTAGQWADPNFIVPGWEIVTSPQAGDIVAISANFSDATGHVGIMISNKESIYAEHSRIKMSDFGYSHRHFKNYPGNSGYVYRRYMGYPTFNSSLNNIKIFGQ